MGRDQRSAEAEAYRALYKDPRWLALRAEHLAAHPVCVTCEAAGRTTAATVVDHKTPHRGDERLFFDPGNVQSLCDEEPYRCHSRHKQREERLGYSPGVGADGFPVDPRHPAYRRIG